MGPDYWMIKAGNDTIGGLRKDKKFEAAHGMICYFEVPSVKEGAAMVTKAGGKLVGENVAINGGENGYFQIFNDLDGKSFSMHSTPPVT
jgi:predicted enzyme related to lactoylglutathione lyase